MSSLHHAAVFKGYDAVRLLIRQARDKGRNIHSLLPHMIELLGFIIRPMEPGLHMDQNQNAVLIRVIKCLLKILITHRITTVIYGFFVYRAETFIVAFIDEGL